MGITDLNKIVGEHKTKISLDDIQGWRIAIDIPIYLNRYVKSTINWQDRLIEMVKILRERFIKPVFIFEGRNAPVEKADVQAARKALRKKQQEKYKELKTLNSQTEETKEALKKLFPKTKIPENIFNLRKFIEQKKQSMKLQIKPIDEDITERAKELLTILGMACVQADGEAETLCVNLCHSKKVNAVLTNDTDVLAYEGKDITVLTDLDVLTSTANIIFKDQLLFDLELSSQEFRDMCILLGCDYNKRVNSFSAVKTYSRIRQYHSIETMIAEKVITEENIDKTKYVRCRELLTCEETNIPILMNKAVDEEELGMFLEKIKSRYNIDTVLNSWVTRDCIFD